LGGSANIIKYIKQATSSKRKKKKGKRENPPTKRPYKGASYPLYLLLYCTVYYKVKKRNITSLLA
jgi:hypothetical protein